MDPESQSFVYSVQKASDSLYDLGSQIRKVEKLLNRNNMPALAKGVSSLGAQAVSASKAVHTVNSWESTVLNPSERAQQIEMTNQLEQLLSRVKEYQQTVAHKITAQKQIEEENIAKQRTTSRDVDENTPLIYSASADGTQQAQAQTQIQQQVLDVLDQAEIDLHSALVEDRDNEIQEIQRGTREINSIFQDLGMLIAEQGHQIDSIEDNVTNLAAQTNNASTQLTRAYNYQKSRGKWTCILLSVLLIITILVALNVLS